MHLAIANLLHHKVRSVLSALAVGIGVAMLVTMLGLTNGSLDEITRRGRAIDADLLIVPRDWNSVMAVAPFTDKHVDKALSARLAGRPFVQRVAPVYREMMTLNKVGAEKKAKDLQTVFGIRPQDWDFFCDTPLTGQRGRLFAMPPGQEQALFDVLRRKDAPDAPAPATQPAVDDRQTLDTAMELVIDRRLADFAHVQVGDRVEGWGRQFRIVGIAPTGVTVRVFAPLSTVRYLTEMPGGATFLLVKLEPGVDLAAARKTLAQEVGGSVMTVGEYSNLLTELWSLIPQYTQIASAIVLTVAFLFVLVIMYTVVLQRTREIGILKSLGASDGYIVGIVVGESMLLSLAGTALGLGLSVLARWGITRLKPLLTVELSWQYLLIGVAVGAIGGLLSGLYPAWVAARQDPVAALSYE